MNVKIGKNKQINTVQFKSFLSLKLDNSEAEKELYNMREVNLRRFNPHVTLFIFLVALANTGYQFFIRDQMIKRNSAWAFTCFNISYAVTLITFMCFITSICVKKPLAQKIINCVNYVLITPALFQIHDILVAMDQVNKKVYYAIFVFEFFIRTVWLFTLLILYSEAIFLHLIILVCLIVIYPIIAQSYTIDDYNVPYNLFMLLQIFISYFYTLQVKKIFRYSFNVKQKNKWFSNILENNTSGFIYMNDGCIDYINNSMLEKIIKNKEILKILQHAELYRVKNKINCIENLNERENNIFIKSVEIENNIKTGAIMEVLNNVTITEKIMDILLSEIECDSIDLENIPYILKTSQKFDINKVEEISNKGFSSKLFVEVFKKKFFDDKNNRDEICNKKNGYNSSILDEKQNFVLLGQKELEIDVETDEGEIKKESLNFEVHCRFYVNEVSKKTENIEFIFKDVTRTKIVEEKSVEFKLKSLILSKVAHEFKNPLICITELIDQIYDEMEEAKLKNSSSLENLINSTLPLIKSLSNYLLILVKDLDYFSQSQSEKANGTEKRDADLKEIIEFVTQISEGLIKKNNKHDDVKFIVDKFPDIPSIIYTDETKLKQILINLQSNAIKFTHKGIITLGVSLDENKDFLKFEVTDTGPGMKDETKANLFKPFKKSNAKGNIDGAGLGLSIVQDLVKQIGGKLDFKSKYGEGTSFWVTIPYTGSSSDNVERKSNYKISINQSANRNSIIKELTNNILRKFSKNSIINSRLFEDSNSIKTISRDSFSLIDLNKCMSGSDSNSQFENINEINSEVDNSIAISVPAIFDTNKIVRNIRNSFNGNVNQIKFASKHQDKKMKRKISFNNIHVTQQYLKSSVISNNNSIVVFENEPNDEIVNTFKINNEPILNNNGTELKSILKNKSANNSNKESNESEALTFIVADDEPLTRQSLIRTFKKAANKLNIKIIIIESQDGIETLNLVYRSFLNKQKISGIITDETMSFLKGSNFAVIMINLLEIKIDVPLFLVSAFDDKSVIKNVELFNDVFSKPLNRTSAEQIITFSYNHTS